MNGLIFILVTTFIEIVLPANILYIDDVMAYSHQNWNYKIAAELLKRDHNVTLIGPKTFPIIEHQNYTYLELTDLLNTIEEKKLLDPEMLQSLGVLGTTIIFYDMITHICQDTLNNEALKRLLDYPKDFHFDLIIVDMTLSGCLYPLIQRFNYPPTVGVLPFLLVHYASESFGNEINPSYVPHLYSGLTDEMSFPQRVLNYFYLYFDMFWREQYYKPLWSEQAKKYYGDEMEHLNTLEKHISIVLSNIMPGFHYPRPITPNIIPVGGLHIVPPTKLPDDLQQIMDNSKNGVIIFSLGTTIRTEELDEDKVQMFVETLARLKETVIWKLSRNLKNIPKNVVIKNFLPQNDLLAHPNTKAFISHCGGLGTIEAVYHGIPVIGVPFAVDQKNIAVQIDKQKMGIALNYATLTGEVFFEAIQEVLLNPVYTETARNLSALVRDQKETPLERAIFWIEWTMRHNGTHILDTKARYLPLFVSSSLDVHLFILTVLVIILWIVKKIFSALASVFFIRKTNKPKMKSF